MTWYHTQEDRRIISILRRRHLLSFSDKPPTPVPLTIDTVAIHIRRLCLYLERKHSSIFREVSRPLNITMSSLVSPRNVDQSFLCCNQWQCSGCLKGSSAQGVTSSDMDWSISFIKLPWRSLRQHLGRHSRCLSALVRRRPWGRVWELQKRRHKREFRWWKLEQKNESELGQNRLIVRLVQHLLHRLPCAGTRRLSRVSYQCKFTVDLVYWLQIEH